MRREIVIWSVAIELAAFALMIVLVLAAKSIFLRVADWYHEFMHGG